MNYEFEIYNPAHHGERITKGNPRRTIRLETFGTMHRSSGISYNEKGEMINIEVDYLTSKEFEQAVKIAVEASINEISYMRNQLILCGGEA